MTRAKQRNRQSHNGYRARAIGLAVWVVACTVGAGAAIAQKTAVEKSAPVGGLGAGVKEQGQAVRRVMRKLRDGARPGDATPPAVTVAPAADGAAAPAPPPPPPPVVAPASPGASPAASGAAATGAAGTASPSGIVDLPGEKLFNACHKLPAGKRIVKLNLKPDTDLMELVGWISSITCTQFLIPGTTTLSGKKITIISPQLITANEAYRLFLAAIESVGLTVEPTDKFLRIVETTRAKFTNLQMLSDGEVGPTDRRYVTRMIRLKHLDATELSTGVLMRIKGEQGDIIPYQKSTLIITDQAAMINKMMSVIEDLDVPQGIDERIWIIRIANTSVIEMASRLAEIFDIGFVGQGFSRRRGANGQMTQPTRPAPAADAAAAAKKTEVASLREEMTITKLIPVERSNQLIVVARPVAFEWLKQMVKKIDVPLGDKGHDRVHVYYCEHSNCDEMAVTLGAVTGIPVAITGQARRGTMGTGASAAPMAAPMGAAGAQNQIQTENVLFEGDVRINFDRPTNALVVVSSAKDYESLRRMIERLDQPRKQVFVEALVMEVALDKSRKVGMAYHGGKSVSLGGDDNSLLLGGFQANQTLSPASLAGSGALNGLAGALFGPVLPQTSTRIFGSAIEIPAIGVLLQALQNNNDVNVLSNPFLTITNNEEGELSVGQNLPFPGALIGGGFGGGAPGGAGIGGFLPSVSVQRQDVALKIKIAPSVNAHNMIRMDVDQEISDIVSKNYNNLGPATSKRTAKTTVITRDQQTVLIGGLMSDRTSETVVKIPVLGDIPILGFFFRSKETSHQKVNIIIALTPNVINEPADLRRVVEKKLRERREFIERFTAFSDDFRLDAEIDYSRKRGMLEEINRSVREIEEEEKAIVEVRARDAEEQSSPIELPPGKSRRKVKVDPEDRIPTPTAPAPAAPAATNEPAGSASGDGTTVARLHVPVKAKPGKRVLLPDEPVDEDAAGEPVGAR